MSEVTRLLAGQDHRSLARCCKTIVPGFEHVRLNPSYSSGNRQRLLVGPHVVYSKECRTTLVGEHVRRNRAQEAALWLSVQNLTQETLARDSDEYGEAEPG